jgi:hypothetical protein
MESRQGVDGYAPDEYDGLHRDQAVAALATGALAAFLVFLWIALEDASLPLILVATVLFALVAESCYLSAFWRRYHYLVWWRQLLIIVAGLPLFVVKAATVDMVVMMLESSADPRAPLSTRSRRNRLRVIEHAVAADGEGNVYEWNLWRGRWEPRPGFEGTVAWHLKKAPLDLSPTAGLPEERIPDPYKPRARDASGNE